MTQKKASPAGRRHHQHHQHHHQHQHKPSRLSISTTSSPSTPTSTNTPPIPLPNPPSTPNSATTSLNSSILHHVHENGRRYHAFRAGAYFLPNDAAEQRRLDLLHHIYSLLLRGQLHCAPLDGTAGPRREGRALDIGTGTGIWAIEFAEQRPAWSVLGTDLSPIQPGWVPPSCHFVVDDVESEWTFAAVSPSSAQAVPGPSAQAFDFIHGRGLAGCIADWGRLLGQCRRCLRPGGWVEVVECEMGVRSKEGGAKAPRVEEWLLLLREAGRRAGKEFDVAGRLEGWMGEAGFVDVRDEVFELPIGPWARDARMKEIGQYALVHTFEALEPYTLALCSRVFGWSRTEIDSLLANLREELRNPGLLLYCNVHVVYGRRPL